MQALKDVITALRRELNAALEESRKAEGELALEPDRVVLSLQLAVLDEKESDGSAKLSVTTLETAKKSSSASSRRRARSKENHTVTVEFRVATSAKHAADRTARPETSAPAPRKSGEITGAEADRAVQSLSEIFGPPGFDSSARATVFREALAGLTDAQVGAIVEALNNASDAALDEPVKRARHLIRNVLRSGPLSGSVTSGERTLAALLNLYPVDSIVRLVELVWKTQDEWLNATLERPSSNGAPRSQP